MPGENDIAIDPDASWFPTISDAQPPVIALDQPATSLADAGAIAPSESGATAGGNVSVPTWALVVAGLGVVMMMGKKGRR